LIRPKRYVDITDEADAPRKLAEHGPIVAELEANGLVRLCALAAEHPGPMVWTVMVDAGATIAASVSTGPRQAPAIYVASVLEDGTVLETQWRPRLKLLLRLGPYVWLDDKPARRIHRLTRRTVTAVLRAHTEQLRAHTSRSAAVVWTTEGYIRFRRAGYWLTEMNNVVRQFVSVPFVVGCALGVGVLLVEVRPGWAVSFLSVAAFVLAVWLFIGRLGEWVGGMIARRLPLVVRERLALEWLKDDDEK
jgi:hypothetical protein